jgi:hypothetical protein
MCSSQELLQPREEQHDIKNERGHSKDDKRFVVLLPTRNCTNEQRYAEDRVKCEISWVRQPVIQDDLFTDADNNHGKGEREKPTPMRVETFF